MTEFLVVGKRAERLDSKAKVTGEAVYTDDLNIPGGMLYGAILRSPYPHARIKSIDASKAREISGVKAVLTAADTPGKKFGPCIADEHLLAVDRVRYVGDEVAAVAATSLDALEKALDLIEVEYEELPSVVDIFAALQPGAPTVDNIVGNNLAQSYSLRRGDAEAGFREAGCILEESFTLPVVSHCCIEPTTCLAMPDSGGRLVIWAPAQSPFTLRNTTADVLDIAPSMVKVIQAVVGGGFGSRSHMKTAFLTALLAQKTGKPVKLTLSREEEFLVSRPRMPVNIKLKMGFAKDGSILAKKTEIMADNGAYTAVTPRLLETTAWRSDNLYRIKNIETSVSLVYTNKVPNSAFRGFGNPQMHFAQESMLDMAAARLGLNPLQVRLRNATQAGDVTAHGWKISSCGLTESLHTAAEASGWEQRKETGGQQGGRKKRGLGMASMIHIAGRRTTPNFPGSNAEVKILETGKVLVNSGEADVGQGCGSLFAQIAAEVLELPLELMEIAPLDTDNSPFAAGTFSDRVTTIGGQAMYLAALDAKQQILQHAEKYLQTSGGELRYEKGVIYDQRSGQSLNFFELLRRQSREIGGIAPVGKATFFPELDFPDPETKYGNHGRAYTFATQVAEVEVDLDTGQVEVLRFSCAHDLGRAINPMAAEGQVEGALSQGLGYALQEEILFEEGKAANLSFLEYKLPTSLDVPPSRVFLIETNEPNGPFGAKGVGEPGLVPTAPAIANAIYQATGARITSLPMTPEKVLKTLELLNSK